MNQSNRLLICTKGNEDPGFYRQRFARAQILILRRGQLTRPPWPYSPKYSCAVAASLRNAVAAQAVYCRSPKLPCKPPLRHFVRETSVSAKVTEKGATAKRAANSCAKQHQQGWVGFSAAAHPSRLEHDLRPALSRRDSSLPLQYCSVNVSSQLCRCHVQLVFAFARESRVQQDRLWLLACSDSSGVVEWRQGEGN